MKKLFPLLLFCLLTISVNAQSLHNDIYFHKTINGLWAINNSFLTFKAITDSNDANLVFEKRNEAISFINLQSSKTIKDLEILKKKYPAEKSVQTLDELFKASQKFLENLSDKDKWVREPMWQMSAMVGDILQEEMKNIK